MFNIFLGKRGDDMQQHTSFKRLHLREIYNFNL